MRCLFPIILSAILLGACDQSGDVPGDSNQSTEASVPPGSPAADAARPGETGWASQSTGTGTTLHLQTPAGDRIISLTCLAGKNRLQVNVPGFTPIGSEERLSFGSGGEVEALVADVRGDRQLGGVSAVGAVPANLAALIGGPISVSYGAQTSGPHPALPREMAGSFVAACKSATSGKGHATLPAPTVNPCLVQDGQKLAVQPLRAIGTEPFWAARIEGRCVTYSHPEDQQGTRVWARYSATPQGGRWEGALDGRPFALQTRAAPGCSDGMSDRVYPIAVELLVQGERRQGCADGA